VTSLLVEHENQQNEDSATRGRDEKKTGKTTTNLAKWCWGL
jgi:hypothetical protein